MLPRPLLWLMLKPSVFSNTLNTLIIAALLGVTTWDKFVYSGDTASFFSSESIQMSMAQVYATLRLSSQSFSEQPLAYNILLIIAALTTALVVYLILQMATRFTANVGETVEDAREGGEGIFLALSESLGMRVLVRCVVALVTLGFLQVTWLALLPLALNQWVLGVTSFDLVGIARCLGVIVALYVALHIYVVLIRLFLLKPRAFGGTYEIMEAMD